MARDTCACANTRDTCACAIFWHSGAWFGAGLALVWRWFGAGLARGLALVFGIFWGKNQKKSKKIALGICKVIFE